MLLPITRFFEDFGRANRTIGIATQATSQQSFQRTFNKALGVMRIVRTLRPGAENDFEVYSNDSLVAAFASVADTVGAGALVISSVALVSAGVGIMNIMLVSVTERTREIGVRKAIGARKRDILYQFLIEAVLLCQFGGMAGVLLGATAGNLLASLMHAEALFPWGSALTGLAVCSAIGVGFGFYPAWHAASLDPIESLRFE